MGSIILKVDGMSCAHCDEVENFKAVIAEEYDIIS